MFCFFYYPKTPIIFISQVELFHIKNLHTSLRMLPSLLCLKKKTQKQNHISCIQSSSQTKFFSNIYIYLQCTRENKNNIKTKNTENLFSVNIKIKQNSTYKYCGFVLFNLPFGYTYMYIEQYVLVLYIYAVGVDGPESG